MNTPLDPTKSLPILMNLMLDDKWLQEAVEAEDELDCDVAAGIGYSPRLGEALKNYLETKSD